MAAIQKDCCESSNTLDYYRAPPRLNDVTAFLAGTFKGTNQAAIVKQLTEAGATIVKKVDDPALTHAIISQAEWDKGAKAQALVQRQAAGDKIHIVNLDWVTESVAKGKKLSETAYAYVAATADAEQDDAVAEEDEEEEEEDTKPKKGAAKGKGKATKRPRSPSPPSPPPKTVKVVQKGGCPVDHLFPHASSCHVFADSSGVYYDATLNQTDLGKNANKFYLVQVLQDDKNNNVYWSWNRWGRVGENGQNKATQHSSANAAIRDFEKKFTDKTRLAWSNRLGPPSAGKYTYLERSFEESDGEGEDVGSSSKSGPAPKKARTEEKPAAVSQLPETVQSLMQMIFNTSSINQTLTSFEYDAKKLPLGKLAKSTLDQGYAALKDLADLVNDSSLAASKYSTSLNKAFESLTNRYYTLIPHAFGRHRPPLIDTAAKLKTELDLADALGQLKITQELMDTAKAAHDGLHPLDSQFKNLGLDELDPIDSSSSTFSTLVKLLQNTKGETHVFNLELVSAFKVHRSGDHGAFDAFTKKTVGGQRRLLWHGSRASNYGGILSRGLLIAPPEAPIQGWMFSKGVYLASMSSKSSQYCYHQISENEGLLMLVEAQLGNAPFYQREQAEYEADISCKKAGFLSTWGIGRTQPAGWQDASILDSELKGVQMPSITKSPVEKNKTSSLLYDEFIVYNTSQVRIRYLLRVKFSSGRYY